jgi:predicted nucleic acid-binding protein
MNAVPSPLRQRRVFVDASAYLAILDEDDAHYAEAAEILPWLAANSFRQFTTNIIIIETYSLVLSALGTSEARKFLRDMSDSHTIVVRANARDEERAKAILFKYIDKDFSFVDAISFAVMERLNISSAFAFDRHFAQYGFAIVTAKKIGR